MKTVKTCELIGSALDWAVAKSEGDEHWTSDRNPDWFAWRMRNWKPSTEWAQCGPLIEKYKVVIETDDASIYWARLPPYNSLFKSGSDHLVAACRAIVAAKLGDTVQIPDELWTAQHDTALPSRGNGKDYGANS